jgi:hypothetical protein
MSSSFNNFLTNNGDGTVFKTYSHASKLYVDNNFARAPKLGYLYFVSFNINPGVVGNWPKNGQNDVGLLVKNVDQPKFKITTETLNQYNRKTNIQTKITYEPITLTFHDDNSEITNNLWINYFEYYYEDSKYGNNANRAGYGDTKYNDKYYRYGLDNDQTQPFFDSIDIFVLHQHNFTQMTIENPLVSSWDHDKLDQTNGTKILENKMMLVYENVYYKTGKIAKDGPSGEFSARYYDNVPGSISVSNTQAGPADVYGNENGTVPENLAGNLPYHLSISEQDKIFAQQTGIGTGAVGLGLARPPGIGISGLNLWSGYGGIHGTGVINAGPIKLALRK